MKPEDKVQVVASAAVTAITTAVAGNALPGLGVVPLLLKATVTEFREGSERRFFRDIVEQLEKRGGDDARESVQELIFNLKSQENTLKLISTAWRSLMEANDPCVGPSLAVLCALYFNKAPDPFFRGLCRVLVELNYAEFTEFQRLIAAISGLPDDVRAIYVDYRAGDASEVDGAGVPMAGVWLHDVSVYGKEYHIGAFDHIERLCYLLKNNGFELPLSVAKRVARPAYGYVQVHVSKEVTGRIAEVIGSSPSGE